ncbi:MULTISPECIES: type II toxin-antitoxin system RelE/ParE family toxin [Burkholderia]|uniref:Type II toxin-antitoxin system RelE/ParE family toxin n=1 Tax=Burkholderia semiarida TaxID=2843303 RepID=A0ABW7L6Y0_9BURK|nr:MULTISPECIES: type II toxin-antitoxin system RelE/ParE family toxin [Burkholderia]KWH60961.1 Killer protein [Burkholderia anthina]MCA7974241.1 type II toxin-antitoxin system RelE/ParE family toxin [Burkholderia sp. AU39826]MCA8036342.1 type II toxin-antitoxin system RelE/ParE family toxin [Burkholderia arboris]MDN7703049.1 type II toxin-antitoxin system RelE/ParE family toxin [Burkholderia sp. AU44665]RQV78292.1 Killer protein [Burkholderia anthina]
MIKSWVHKGLEAFFVTGSKAGIRPDHAPRLRRMLARLDVAGAPHDMNVPGWRFHGLAGALGGHYAVGVNGNWRLTFRFDGPDVVLVDYQDYH